ncbi:hypothetical protein FF1_017968 [Malus domestica]
MQARVDPHLESIRFYAALIFRSRNHPKDDPLDRVSAAEDLFQLQSMCSASCGSSKSVALLAPVVREVYNVSVDLFKRDLSLKREKKVMRKFRTKLALDISKSDSLQPAASKLDGKKVDDELLFYIDNKGEDEHKDEEDEKVNRSTNAAHTMTSSEKRGRKRKGKNAEKKEKIKLDSSQYDGTVWLSNFT